MRGHNIQPANMQPAMGIQPWIIVTLLLKICKLMLNNVICYNWLKLISWSLWYSEPHHHTFLGETHDVIQLRQLTKAALGGTVTLDCFYPVDFEYEPLQWYRQILGQKPQVMVKKLRSTEAWDPYFDEDFKSGRITVQKSKDTFNLTIRNIISSDEATYYCAVSMYNEIKFGNGTFLALTGMTLFTVVHPNY